MEKDVPADWIVSEEDAEAAAMAVPEEHRECTVDQLTVWVDPLDGTKEYTEGFLDHVTVLIGIAVGKRAVAGVINQPFFNYEKKVRGENVGCSRYMEPLTWFTVNDLIICSTVTELLMLIVNRH